MTKGGPLLSCPKCGEFVPCRSVPLYKAGKEAARSLYYKSHPDIRWYRRARQCSKCEHLFLTAEIAERFLEELISLRDRVVKKRQAGAKTIRSSNAWIDRPETISKELAQGFLRASCWWLTHSSGNPVRAPGHADRLFLDKHHGWAIEFGANTFLVGKAIERCAMRFKEFLDAIGDQVSTDKLRKNLRSAIAGAVANYDGNEYDGYYPITDDQLTFGAQAIDLNDAVAFLVNRTGVDRLLE